MEQVAKYMKNKNKFIFLFIFILFLISCRPKPYITPYAYEENQRALLLFERAKALQEEKKYKDAIIEYRHYLDYYGKLFDADDVQFNIATCYKELGQYKEAISNYYIYIKVYKRQEKIPEAYFNIAYCYELSNDYKRAVKIYMLIIKKYFRTPYREKAVQRINIICDAFPVSKWAKKIKKQVPRLIKKLEKK